MAEILCVEDNVEFFIYLTDVLKGHRLTHARSLKDAFRLVQNGRQSFDLVLLDAGLPDGNGIRAIEGFKETFTAKVVPIIVLSADGDIISKVAAFGLGAEDYIQKPPESSELKARIEARLRWANAQENNRNQILIGDLTIDSDKMSVEQSSVKWGRKSVDLTPSEFKLLRLICSRPGQVFSRDRLIDHIWGVSKNITERTVDAHISHLRKKLRESTVRIETVLSAGYKVEV